MRSYYAIKAADIFYGDVASTVDFQNILIRNRLQPPIMAAIK